MENIHLEGTQRTPLVHFDAIKGILEVSGRSIPENSIGFYKPLFDWIDEYIAHNPQATTTMLFNLEYFNTASSKCILDILRKLEALHNNDKSEVVVKWHYDEGDEDMKESGEDFKSLIDLEIELHEKE